MTHQHSFKRNVQLLQELSDSLHTRKISFNKLFKRLNQRGLALGVLVFALPNIIPLGLPVISSVSGLLIMILSMQMLFSRNEIWFPEFIRKRKIATRHVKKIIHYSLPTLRFIEKYTHPRWQVVIDVCDRFVSILIFVLAFIIFLPIPFVNAIFSICICLLAIALLERDGFFILVGMAISLIILILNYQVLGAALRYFFEH